MLYETQIGKLSKQRINNLLKGKSVRIKSGTAHTVYLTEQQLKRFHRNSKQGKAYTVKLNSEQIAKQGSGLVADLVGLVHPTAGKIASIAGLGMKKSGDGIFDSLLSSAMFVGRGKKKAGDGIVADLVGLVHPTAGKIASIAGLGVKGKKKVGDGIVADLVGLVHPTAGKIASIAGLGVKGDGITDNLANSLMFSAGVHNKLYGRGFLTDLAKKTAVNLAKEAGKAIVDKGTNIAQEKASDFLKSKIEGMGRVKRRASPAQLEALMRGRAKRDANRQSRGGALFAAGY